ncbi:MAG: ATP-binding protein [Candidatus Levyibacteriota bacterium]
MKILLTGTIHVGKSTLLNSLESAELPNVVIVPEIAREILSQNPELEKDPNLQDILFAEQVRREREATSNDSIAICDRGVLDIVAHSKLFGHEIKPEWLQWLRTYDLTFLLNKDDVPFSGENRAFSDPERDWIQFRNALDDNIKLVLTENNLRYEQLSGSIESRLSHLASRTRETSVLRESYGRRIERI